MKYILEADDIQQTVGAISNLLPKIEVKGDSVEHLYALRIMFNKLLGSLTEAKEEHEEKKEEI